MAILKIVWPKYGLFSNRCLKIQSILKQILKKYPWPRRQIDLFSNICLKIDHIWLIPFSNSPLGPFFKLSPFSRGCKLPIHVDMFPPRFFVFLFCVHAFYLFMAAQQHRVLREIFNTQRQLEQEKDASQTIFENGPYFQTSVWKWTIFGSSYFQTRHWASFSNFHHFVGDASYQW